MAHVKRQQSGQLLSCSHECLRKCEVLIGRAPAFLDSLLEHMTVQLFSDGAIIAKEGEEADMVYFMYRGHVEVTVGETVVAQLGDGSVLGELPVLGTPITKHTATTRALGFCDCRIVRSLTFMRVLKGYSKELAFFRSLADKRSNEIEKKRQENMELQRQRAERPSWKWTMLAMRRHSSDAVGEDAQEEQRRRQGVMRRHSSDAVGEAAQEEQRERRSSPIFMSVVTALAASAAVRASSGEGSGEEDRAAPEDGLGGDGGGVGSSFSNRRSLVSKGINGPLEEKCEGGGPGEGGLPTCVTAILRRRRQLPSLAVRTNQPEATVPSSVLSPRSPQSASPIGYSPRSQSGSPRPMSNGSPQGCRTGGSNSPRLLGLASPIRTPSHSPRPPTLPPPSRLFYKRHNSQSAAGTTHIDHAITTPGELASCLCSLPTGLRYVSSSTSDPSETSQDGSECD
mmetsp:Transcript_53071/g.120061  ORF Transcript_53071/g.120061 Transcript_53071/m.120061 type:complete len:454 (+) Transcript_53071:54-1415(+)